MNSDDILPDLHSQVEVLDGPGDSALPLTIQAKDDNSVDFLKRWIGANREWVRKKTIEHGAVRFRGFEIASAKDCEDTLLQLDSNLSDKYRGTSPRTLQAGTKYVFSASEFPACLAIPQHIEMSFLPAPPRWLYFCCLDAPTSVGGETSLCDFRKVFKDLNPEFKRRMYEKKLKYVRNYYRKSKNFRPDMTQVKGWEDLFGTTDKEVVEEDAKNDELTLKWHHEDRLTLSNTAEPFQLHPDTGEPLWCSHMQVFHARMLVNELRRAALRTGNWFQIFLSWFLIVFSWLLLVVKGGKNLGWHTMYGDGTEISTADQDHLQDTIWKNLVFDRWQLGDLLMIDNCGVSHGRQPYTGKRKIVVSWSDAHRKQNLPIPELEA